jgi:superfamily I DNA and/or RNA helicase
LGLLEFAGKLDEFIKTYLLNSTIFMGNPKFIQNELSDHILEACQDEIFTEIRQCKFLSVIPNNSTDISEHI